MRSWDGSDTRLDHELVVGATGESLVTFTSFLQSSSATPSHVDLRLRIAHLARLLTSTVASRRAINSPSGPRTDPFKSGTLARNDRFDE